MASARRWTLRLFAIAASVLACDDGSLGLYASGDPDSTSTTGETSTSSSSENESGLTTLQCGDSRYACDAPRDCETEACSGWFMTSGCPYPACSTHQDCQDGNLCLDALAWGQCLSSELYCSELDGACLCVESRDCRGRACVPNDEYPVEIDRLVEVSSTAARIDLDTSGDGPAVLISLDGPVRCDSPFSLPRTRIIAFDRPETSSNSTLFTLSGRDVSQHDLDGDGSLTESETTSRGYFVLEIREAENGQDTGHGRFELYFDRTMVYGTFDDATICRPNATDSVVR